MALRALEPPAARASHIFDLLAPFPGRAEFALRLAVICALTLLVVQIYQTPEPALTIYVAFFVIKSDRTASILVSIVMLLLMTFVIGMTLLLAMAVLDRPLWRVMTIILMSFCLLFAASASKLKEIGGIIALIAGYALDVLGSVQIGEVATRALLYAWLFVAMPASVSILVNLFVGPSPRRLVERNLAFRLRLAAEVLRDPDGRRRSEFDACLRAGPGELFAWLKHASLERTNDPDDLAALEQAARSTGALMALVDMVVQARHQVRSLAADLAACLEEMAVLLERGAYPIEIAFQSKVESDTPPALKPTFAMIDEVLADFAVSPPTEPAAATKKNGGFFVADAFTSRAHVQYALKATAAAMLCFFIYNILDWPGIHTAFITCFIVSLGTTGETIEKLTLRILGAMIGAALGLAAIVFVMPDITSIGQLMLIVAFVALASGWISAGRPRISYIGFQLAFAFFLCAVQGLAPEFDLAIARDRVIGIFLGNLVVAVIFTQIWPVTLTDRIDPAIVGVLRKLASMAKERVPWKRCSRLADVQTTLESVAQDMVVLEYEPPSIRADTDWLACRRRILAALHDCQGPLFLIDPSGPAMREERARRLDQLADTTDGRPPALRPAMRAANGSWGAPVVNESGTDAALDRLERVFACLNGCPSNRKLDHGVR